MPFTTELPSHRNFGKLWMNNWKRYPTNQEIQFKMYTIAYKSVEKRKLERLKLRAIARKHNNSLRDNLRTTLN